MVRMQFPLTIPAPPGYADRPVWTGESFRIGNITQRVLSYEVGASGWTDELTEMHQDADDEHHYINVASREQAVYALKRWVAAPEPVIIDIGCSSGYTIKALRRAMTGATIIGADYVRGPLEKLGSDISDLPLLHFDLVNCPLPGNSFDGLTLLNVLEHIEDDSAAIRQVARILKPGGVAAIEVPAGPHLYDVYDKHLMHFRRYEMADLLRKISSAGLRVLDRSHFGFFLYPAFWYVKKRNRRFMHADASEQHRAVMNNMRQSRHSRVMTGLMKIEETIRRRVYLPVGIRCVVTCQKP